MSEVRSRSLPLSGWGRFPTETCDVYRPEKIAEVAEIVRRAPQGSLTPRGLGRSYGDAALNAAGAVVWSTRLDRMLSFDPESGILHCEAAVSLADILDTLLPRGFGFPVTPGTKFVTVAGAIAADVHGKNHHQSGSMAESLINFQLLTAEGEVLSCSREQNPDVFWATIGGMGLTGFILEAHIRLRRVPSAWMAVDGEKARDLDDALERCAARDAEYDYAVAWIDCLATGGSRGRSVLARANYAEPEELPARLRATPHALPSPFTPTVPITLPDFALSRLVMRPFNEGVYRVQRPGRRIVSSDRYFYPLDWIHHWNRIYGRRGLVQYQFVVSREAARQAILDVLEGIARAGQSVFLAVLKSFGESSGGLISFPAPGFTLALDLPNTGEPLRALLRRLDERVLHHGGRVYLAKDATLAPEHLGAMYPGLSRFLEVKERVDPAGRFASSLSRRLGLTE